MTSSSSGQRDALAALRIQRPEESTNTVRPRKRWFRRLLAVVVLLAIAAGGYLTMAKLGWIGEAPRWLQVPEIIQSRIEVRVTQTTVESGRSADALVVASGYLESRRQAKIGARAPGRIEAVNVEEGAKVTKNQVLAVLEHADLDASLSATRASRSRVESQIAEQEISIAQAKRELDRATELWNSKAMSEAEHDKKRFEYDSLVARLKSLKADADLADARISESEQLRENMFVRAPFDGTVISKDGEVGESIMPGGMGEASGRGSVVTIADLSNLEVECDVKEDYISRVTEGQSAEIAIDAVPDRRYQGRVRKVIPMGDRARATIKVKVQIIDADDRLFPEMSGRVYFLPQQGETKIAESVPRMFVPSSSVVSRDGVDVVWVVDSESRVHHKSVKAGEAKDGRREISEGLAEGDHVVVDPPELSDGQLVKSLDY